MDNMDQIVTTVLQEIQKCGIIKEQNLIPVGISNRHVHLSEEHLISLFGEDAKLCKIKDLSQPGQFACQECVTVVGPKGCIENIRILGPTRAKTQIELLAADCFKLGVKAPLRESGKLTGTPGIAICGPRGCVNLSEGAMIAKRHIHMTPQDAERFCCRDNEIVRVGCCGERGGILDNVVVRVTEASKLDFHIDIEEANCMGIIGSDKVKIIK
ncbi:MAG TPA: phosphate propanoyltransferase [Anaerovoracaceae bacterium]|nr:phosphate propanoyltransferase [Anaerovoracaceae bacterium]